MRSQTHTYKNIAFNLPWDVPPELALKHDPTSARLQRVFDYFYFQLLLSGSWSAVIVATYGIMVNVSKLQEKKLCSLKKITVIVANNTSISAIGTGVGSITSCCSGKEPALLPELMTGLMDLALLILTNEKSACLNRAGCINYLSRSSKVVVRYQERSR